MPTFTIAIFNKTNLLPLLRRVELFNARWRHDNVSPQFRFPGLWIRPLDVILGTIVADPGVERMWALVELWYPEWRRGTIVAS